jgi:hypothetical protein
MLGIAAWLMLAWIAIGYVTALSAVDSWLLWIEGTRFGKGLIATAILLMGASAVFLWIAALRVAAERTERGSPGRFALFGVLILGNVVAAFFYYFLHVLWERVEPSSAAHEKSVPRKPSY